MIDLTTLIILAIACIAGGFIGAALSTLWGDDDGARA